MKRKLTIISILIIVGVTLFAANFTPIATWPFKGLNAQRTGQTKEVTDINPKNLDVEWMYPSISEDTDYIVRTIDSSSTIIGSEWISSKNPAAQVEANPDRIWTGGDEDPHFLYTIGEAANTSPSYVEFNFDGLREGDEYQVFMSVPSDLTVNTTGYNLATSQYVMLEYQDENGFAKSGEYAVNISREEYAGSWMYITGNLVTIGPDGKLSIKISNKCSYNVKSDDENSTVYSDTAIGLADAVRIVRVYDRDMVGSSVACSFPKSSFILDSDNVEYDSSAWVKASNHFGFYVNDNFFMTNTHPNAVPLHNNMFVLKPDCATTDKTFTYNFTIDTAGLYKLFSNNMMFLNTTYALNGKNYKSFVNYPTQKYSIYKGSTLVDSFSVDMIDDGWDYFGTVELSAGSYKMVMEPTTINTVPTNGDAPSAYVVDAIKFERANDNITALITDVGSNPVGIAAFNMDLRDTELGADFSNSFLSSIGVKDYGFVSAFQIKGSTEYWKYPNYDCSKWIDVEGPVRSFATSPTLSYIPDPNDPTKTILAAFVGDCDGIVYGFDVTGAEYGSTGLHPKSKLLFKGPGIFLPEPIELAGTSEIANWSVSDSNYGSFGSRYLYTDSPYVSPIKWNITDDMREKAGDATVYNMNKSLTGFVDKSYSQWNWKVKFWVPPVEKSVGTHYTINVTWFNEDTGDNGYKNYDVQIDYSDLGTWKSVSVNDTYKNIKSVSIAPMSIPSGKVAIVDNIWLYPALPAGEVFDFTEGCEFVTNTEKYLSNDVMPEMNASLLFTPTSEGRMIAYDIKNGIDGQNKIAKIAWEYPKFADRKTEAMASAPSYTNSRLYWTARPYNSPNNIAMYSLDTTNLVNYLNGNFTSGYYTYEEPLVNIMSETIQNNLFSGVVNYLPNNVGEGYTYSLLGNSNGSNFLHKLRVGNSLNANATLLPSQNIDSVSNSTPSVCEYTTNNGANTQAKILFPDLNAKVYSYEIGSGDIDSASSNFTSPETTNATNGNTIGNIVTDYYYDETTQNHIPNGFYGSDDGYVTAFNAVTGEKINRLIAGMQYDDNRKQITSSPLLLPNADAEGESIVNINGADGYNYTYNYHVYNEKKKWKNNLAIGSNWKDLLEELEVVPVDPTDIEELADIQLEVVDYETAKALLDLYGLRDVEDSTYKKMFSTDILKRDEIDDKSDTFIRKDMMVLDKQAWGYVMTGSKGIDGDPGSIDTQEKAERLRNYLKLEAQKCRMNYNFKGEKNTASGASSNKSRALFYELDNASGQVDPRKNDKGVTLEWGDHIYLALWNMPAKASLKGLAPVVFEYQNGRVNINAKTTSSTKRQVPASVTKIYSFPTYDVAYENKGYNGVDDNEKYKKVLTSTGASVQRKLTLIDVTLDCTRNRIPSMIGSGYKLAVDLTLPNYSGKVIRYYVSSLNSGVLGDDIDPVLVTDTSDWVKIDSSCYREEFTINNPLTLKVGSHTYGKTYQRYDDANSYNGINGVKEADIETVSIGEFSHGYLSPIKDVAIAANRSEMNINNFRYSANNHEVSSNTVKIGSQSAGESNYYSNKMPWEYGVGSADYPAVDKNNVEVLDEDGEDIISYDSILKTEKPWTTGKSKTPYLEGRTGNVDTDTDKKAIEIRYQIEVPRYQPAMKQYVSDAIVYIDSDANGKFSNSGTYDAPAYTCEPYRRFKIAFGVNPAAELYVDEDFIYIGEPGHGLGYPLAMNGIFTPYQEGILGLQTNSLNQSVSYNPYSKKPEVMKWFKPFTVYNDGNVNLFDLSLIKEPLFKVDANNNMSTLNEGIETSLNYNDDYKNRLRISEYNVVSSFDTKAYLDIADNSVDLGAIYPFSSNRANFGTNLAAGRSLTITKPRVGDMDGVYMSIPDGKKTTGNAFKLNGDYNRKFAGSDYELDVRDAQNPMVSVEVPIGQPVGEYRSINPMRVSAGYIGKGGVAYIISGNGIYLDVNVREAQVTGVPYDKNTAHASLYGMNPGDNNLTYYKYPEFFVSYPVAFQNKDNEISLAFSDNMIANYEDLDLDELDKSKMPLNFSLLNLRAKNNVGKSINETNDFYDRDYWWSGGSISIKENGWPNVSLDGYDVTNWNDDSDLKMSYFMYPSYYRNGSDEYITFSGKAQLEKDGKLQADKNDNRIFYIMNGSDEAISLGQLDTSKEKKNPVMFMRDNKKWFFFESTVDDKSSISFTTDDIPNDYKDAIDGYTPEMKVRIPDAITSASKPNVIDRDSQDNNIELIYTGVNKVTGGIDVYMSEYSLDSNVDTGSQTAGSDIQIYALTQNAKPLSRTYDILKRDPKFDFYVAKGIAWARQDVAGSVNKENLPAVVVGLGGDYNSEEHEKYINVFTGENVVFKEDDWKNGKVDSLPIFDSMTSNGAYPKFSFDNGVMTVEYAPDSEAFNELGKTLVDFSSGVIRFTKIKDLSESEDTAGNSLTVKNPTVYASYIPQAISLTNGDGINDGGFATYDKDYDDVVVMWRKTGVNSSNGLYYKVIRPYRDAKDRLMYVTILDNKKVETDASVVTINENSISGFFDNNTKGNNDGKGYGKLWLFWSGTKGGKNDVYYLTEAIDENNLLVNFGN